MTPSYLLLTGVIVPLLAQALMLVGPLVLFVTIRRFDEPLDGLVFGAASGLGFAAAQSVIYSWQLIFNLPHIGLASVWVLPMIRIALLVPLLDAATTAFICTALWLRRGQHGAVSPADWADWLANPWVALLIGALGQIVPSLGYDLTSRQFLDLVWYGSVTAVMLVLLRVQVHHGLLRRAQALGHGGTLTCPHCHHQVGDVAFCPYCGLALRAMARRARKSAGPAPAAENAHD